ncbi:MAG: hypothetical protein L6V86_08515 [Treponema sp.]|nr:MAG: hypothetical protein L6V86_08515 [Treponema sp.]
MRSFLGCAERRCNYLDCLNQLDNFLLSHSKDIKLRKMNNINGVHRIIVEIEKNIDEFIEYGEDVEIPCPK